jgi:hypothetical protein
MYRECKALGIGKSRLRSLVERLEHDTIERGRNVAIRPALRRWDHVVA